MADITTKYKSKFTGAEIDAKLERQTNPNLLDNWYFGNPVNQRGQTEYSGVVYGIDRWKTNFSSDKVIVTENGVKNVNASTSTGWHLHQVRNVPATSISGDMITLSVWITERQGDRLKPIVSFRDASDSEISALTFTAISNGVNSVSKKMPAGTAKIRVGLYAASGVAAGDYTTMLAAKLELGAQQTLAHQDADGNWVLNEIPNYAEELAKCQRYYQLFSSEAARPAALADYRPLMRITPATGTIVIDGVTYYYADANL